MTIPILGYLSHHHFLSALVLLAFTATFHFVLAKSDDLPRTAYELVGPQNALKGSQIFHVQNESHFNFTWTIRIARHLIATNEELPRLYVKKFKSYFVNWQYDDFKSQPFRVISVTNAVDLCDASYFTIKPSTLFKSDSDSIKYFDIALKIPKITQDCIGEYKLQLTVRDVETIVSDFDINVYEKANFGQHDVILKVDSNQAQLQFDADIHGLPAPNIRWTCERVLASESFEFREVENQNQLWISTDFLSYMQCINVKCTISNHVCEGFEFAKESVGKGNVTCYDHTLSLSPMQEILGTFLAPRTISPGQSTIADDEPKLHESMCKMENKFCKRVFESDYLTSKLNRDLMMVVKESLAQFGPEITPLCEQFVFNLTCSYSFTDETCSESEDEKILESEFYKKLYNADQKYFCNENVKLLRQFCPANFISSLFMDTSLASDCQSKYKFENQFPERSCLHGPSSNKDSNFVDLWRYNAKRSNYTLSGTCVRWDTLPKKLFDPDTEFLPHTDLSNNYCRHVLTKNLTHPGCFVTSYAENGYVFRTCSSIAKCPIGGVIDVDKGNVFTVSGNEERLTQPDPLTDSWIFYATPVLFIIVMLSISIVAFVYYRRCASRVSLVPLSPEVLTRTNVQLHRNPKYEGKEADAPSSHINSSNGAFHNPSHTNTSSSLLSVITRPCKHSQQNNSAPHSTSINMNRHSMHSNPTSARHDSFTSNAGSERAINTMRPSPSVGSEFGFFHFDVPDGHMFNTFNRIHHQTLRQIDPRLEYDRNSIQYITDLGTGAFGQVFHAQVTDKNNPERKIEVAVKMLKDGQSPDTKRSFQLEAQLLANFSHPNIVKLRGVCSKGTPFCMLMDYMKYGDLRKYLAAHNGNSSDGAKRQLSSTDLLMISQQVASGMSYVSEKNYIHRDLATRNCLVGENLVVKITDFGLSKQLKDGCEFLMLEASDGVVPMRWMSPEALSIGRYSRQSDVWSFGVLLWEVFTYAMQPYYDKDNQSLVDFVTGGGVLDRHCGNRLIPEDVYQVMLQCWAMQPAKRPSFRSLYEQLDSLLKKYTAASMPVLNHQHSMPAYPPPPPIIHHRHMSQRSLSRDSGGTTGLPAVPATASTHLPSNSSIC